MQIRFKLLPKVISYFVILHLSRCLTLFLIPFYCVNTCWPFVYFEIKKNTPLDQITRKVVSENTKCRPNKCALVFIVVVVACKHTVYILYYEIHLKYFLGMDVYRKIDNLFQQWKTILRTNARVSCPTEEPGYNRKTLFT